MPQHQTELITMLALGVVLAFGFGLAARFLRLPALIGYLLAGIAIGPNTPGIVGNVELARQMSELGVILLMFGVGLHFSLNDLLVVRRIAVPGAMIQIVTATLIGTLVSRAWGWNWSAGLVFGLALSVASTVVLLRALDEVSLLDSPNGRIAVGWLVVEDIAMVLALVVLPAFAAPVGADAPGHPRMDGAFSRRRSHWPGRERGGRCRPCARSGAAPASALRFPKDRSSAANAGLATIGAGPGTSRVKHRRGPFCTLERSSLPVKPWAATPSRPMGGRAFGHAPAPTNREITDGHQCQSGGESPRSLQRQ
ncbi:hypothetical protein HMPREF9695_05037 [Afipia broomeae ATCC 49717]|uniref:Cation/H+ exchanger transmembrane domain-containing protein n=1 Tax=Afipia broomeae ATCC 49717 TaxID=883078 RepID=K8NRL8_9BRAD|nr:hypothetical protein HMPREF9695_05037 [Afipia broomeae ATCC 49717]